MCQWNFPMWPLQSLPGSHITNRDCHCQGQSPLTVPAQLLHTPHSQPGQVSSQLPPQASLGRVSISIKHFIQGTETQKQQVPQKALTKGISGLLSPQVHTFQSLAPRSSPWALDVSPSVPHLAGATCPLPCKEWAVYEMRTPRAQSASQPAPDVFPNTMYLYS